MAYNFSEEDKISGWFKFENLGDRIQGTYIGKREQMNVLSGKMQKVYELKTEDGFVWNIGGKDAIDSQMKLIKLGQIVEFRFIEERKSNRPGMNAAKIIQIFAKKDLVDQAWLLEQEAGIGGDGTYAPEQVTMANEDRGEIKVEDVPFNEPAAAQPQAQAYQPAYTPPSANAAYAPATAPINNTAYTPAAAPAYESTTAPVNPNYAKVAEIVELAKKLGVTPGDEMQMKTKVMEATGLAFIETNLDKIIEKLRIM